MPLEEISQGESDRLEFKRALTKDDTKWIKTVVAFANGRGGRIVFGIDSDRTVVGMGEDLFDGSWGSGVKRYMTEITEAGLRTPEIVAWPNALRVNVFRKKTPTDPDHIDSGPSATKPELGPESWPQSWPQTWPQSWPESWPKTNENKVLSLLFFGEKSRRDLAQRMSIGPKTNSFRVAISRLLREGWVEPSIPDRPNSRLQKYRLTDKGRAALAGRKDSC